MAEVKDCVKCASMQLLYKAPHATRETSLAKQLEEEVAAMVGDQGQGQGGCRVCGARCQWCHTLPSASA